MTSDQANVAPSAPVNVNMPSAAISPADGHQPLAASSLDPDVTDLQRAFENVALEKSTNDAQAPIYPLNFVGLTSSNEPASLRHQQAFPLLRQPHSQATTASLLVSKDVFDLAPHFLLEYFVPAESHVSSAWSHRLAVGKQAAKYIAYPFLEASQVNNANQARLALFDRWTASYDLRNARSPPALGPPAVQHLNRLPQELFDGVVRYLLRDDVKALRLTSRWAYARTAEWFFQTFVLAFRPGVFGEMLQTRKGKDSGDGEGKNPSITISNSFGHRIRRLGISHRVDQALLSGLEEQMHVKSYWGSFHWPTDYRQYDFTPVSAVKDVLEFERVLAEIRSLKELALSLDSGLGWQAGPSNSLRDQIIQPSVEMFPNAQELASTRAQVQEELWDKIKSQYAARGMMEELARSRLFKFEGSRCSLDEDVGLFSGVRTGLDRVDEGLLMEAVALGEKPLEPCHRGLLVTALDTFRTRSRSAYPIRPDKLSQSRLAGLMKAQFTQELLIDTFIVGVIDSETCRAVSSLNLACLPARFIEDFNRLDFWEALPCLETCKIMVMGELGIVHHGGPELLEHASKDLTAAVVPFMYLLMRQISPRRNIRTLTFGWASGGEKATGLLARNRHLLPAPFIDDDIFPWEGMMDGVLRFPHVRHLTIANCWMTPNAVEYLVEEHRHHRLEKLTLDSVSLQVLPQTAGGDLPASTVITRLRAPEPNNVQIEWPFRHWSWPELLDAISPAANFSLLGKPTRAAPDPGALDEIELVSCGHSVIGHAAWNLMSIDSQFFRPAILWDSDASTAHFRSRRAALAHQVPRVCDTWLGTVVQHLPPTEAVALEAIWGATIGWDDEDARLAVMMDGLRPGGTGRFSAVIRARKSDRPAAA